MASCTELQRAARMHTLAAQFRGFAAQTEWPLYRARLLEMAVELDHEAARLDGYRMFALKAAS